MITKKEKIQTFWTRVSVGWLLEVTCHAHPGSDAHKLTSTATRGKAAREREWPLVGNSAEKTATLMAAIAWCKDQTAKDCSLASSHN